MNPKKPAPANPPAGQKPLDRQQATLLRIQAALLADRLAVIDLAGENTGSDPYNSSSNRSNRAVWNKRSL